MNMQKTPFVLVENTSAVNVKIITLLHLTMVCVVCNTIQLFFPQMK